MGLAAMSDLQMPARFGSRVVEIIVKDRRQAAWLNHSGRKSLLESAPSRELNPSRNVPSVALLSAELAIMYTSVTSRPTLTQIVSCQQQHAKIHSIPLCTPIFSLASSVPSSHHYTTN